MGGLPRDAESGTKRVESHAKGFSDRMDPASSWSDGNLGLRLYAKLDVELLTPKLALFWCHVRELYDTQAGLVNV